MTEITFQADKVKVKSGHRIDNSGEVTFLIGEYQLSQIKDLVTVVDKPMQVIVKITSDNE